MTTASIRALARVALPFALSAIALAGCASVDSARTPAARTGTATTYAAAPAQSTAAFSSALRCMDTLLADFGTRDLSVIVENLTDAREMGGGTKDLLIAVVSDMTQRSRAIRLVGSGNDWGNTVSYLSQSKDGESIAVVPQYALRGSISQLDPASDLAVAADLTMLNTKDLTVVPGVATRNSVVVASNGAGEIRKYGFAYGLPAAADRAKALRALVELTAIELFGRLAKVPYWTCLGATDAHETVAVETQDWYDAMAARPTEIIKYFQAQLRLRGVYDGPIDGAVNAQLKDAVARYREVLGLSHEPKLSLDFFRAYLRADHYQLAARLKPPAVASVTPAAAPAVAPAASPAVAPLSLNIATANDARRFARGEAVRLTIRPSRDAHVYCFLQDEQRKIRRFFPNRFQRDSHVPQAEGLQLPGAMRFEILMNARGVLETVACFATERDVLPRLPAGVSGGDFEPLPVTSLEQVHSAFAQVADGVLAQHSFELRAK